MEAAITAIVIALLAIHFAILWYSIQQKRGLRPDNLFSDSVQTSESVSATPDSKKAEPH